MSAARRGRDCVPISLIIIGDRDIGASQVDNERRCGDYSVSCRSGDRSSAGAGLRLAAGPQPNTGPAGRAEVARRSGQRSGDPCRVRLSAGVQPRRDGGRHEGGGERAAGNDSRRSASAPVSRPNAGRSERNNNCRDWRPR